MYFGTAGLPYPSLNEQAAKRQKQRPRSEAIAKGCCWPAECGDRHNRHDPSLEVSLASLRLGRMSRLCGEAAAGAFWAAATAAAGSIRAHGAYRVTIKRLLTRR